MIGGKPSSSTLKDNQRRRQQNEGEDDAVRDDVAVPIPPVPFPSLEDSGVSETREKFLSYGVPLYLAAMGGDWETAKIIFNKDPTWITAPITKRKDTALHIATAAKHVEFVKHLVNQMFVRGDNLESVSDNRNTAFCLAAASGEVKIAMLMVEKNNKLPDIRGSEDLLPLRMAILLGHKDMVEYLMKVTSLNLFKDEERIELVTSAIEADLYEVALQFISILPHLACFRNSINETVLHTLAQKPLSKLKSKRSIWKRLIRFCTNMAKDEGEQKLDYALQLTQKAWEEVIKKDENEISNLIGFPTRLLFIAAEMGNVDFLIKLILSYPDVIWKVDDKSRSIFHIAIIYRHEEIFKLIYEIGAIKDLIASYTDDEDNNMLHLAANIAPSDRLNCVSGAALQMQRELLWFEAVKKVVQPHLAMAKNKVKMPYREDLHRADSFETVPSDEDTNEPEKMRAKFIRKTPQAIFTEKHEQLRLQGEEWMKKTAESCTLVATLITTVVFTAAFTLPGGNDDKSGSPILLKQLSFKIFAISNAITLFASATSILMFLSILTSRYAEGDFLKVLPFKLMVGLTSLFVSIASMMVSFTATFFIVFQDDSIWIPAPIALLAAIPVLLFAFQQSPLLWDIYSSTYRSWTLFQPSDKGKLCWDSQYAKKINEFEGTRM